MSVKIFFLPVNTGYYSAGSPTQQCIDFYNKRSLPGLYCSIVGNVSTLRGFATNSRTGIISKTGEWNKLADSIKTNGTMAGIQLSRTWQGYSGQQQFINEKWLEYKNYLITQLKNINLTEIFNDFAESIQIAADFGFNHIQIHAAHGYLLSSLLDPDLYLSPEKVIDTLENICSHFKNLELSIRVSTFCGLSQDIEKRRADILCHIYSGSFKYVDLSEGYYNFDKSYIYPFTLTMKANRLERCLKIANEFPNQQFIISGWTNPHDVTRDNVHKGFCRNIIANPEFVICLTETCENCGDCHYHSMGRESLVCRRWDNGRGKGDVFAEI